MLTRAGQPISIHFRDTVTTSRDPPRRAGFGATRATRSRIIGIAGGSRSGKNTVACRTAEALGLSSAVTLDMDGYYRNLTHLSPEERRRANWDHPNAFDLDPFTGQLHDLAIGKPIDKPVYDFETDEILDQYLSAVPMHLEFVEPTKRYADVILPRGGHNAMAIEMVVTKIRHRLAEPHA